MLSTTVTLIDVSGDVFFRRFSEIINAFPLNVSAYTWYLVSLNGEGDVHAVTGLTMADLVARLERDGGLRLSFDDVRSLTKVLTQVFDLRLIAVAAEQRRPIDDAFETLTKKYPIVVEAFDSSEWRIGGTDAEAVAAVANALR